MMNNNPMNHIMNALQQGVNPNQIAMQLAQNNPSVRQAMQLVNGKPRNRCAIWPSRWQNSAV